MNQNDMDRYFWRTGQRWSGDSRLLRELQGPRLKRTGLALFLLFAASLMMTVLVSLNWLR